MNGTNANQGKLKTPTLNDVMRSIAAIRDVARTPSKARMNEMTWAIMSNDPRITDYSSAIPAPNYNSLAGLKVVFDDTLPAGKIEYE